MSAIKVTFEEALLIKRALLEAVYEARREARRGAACGNTEMRDHYEDHANTINDLVEKIMGQIM